MKDLIFKEKLGTSWLWSTLYAQNVQFDEKSERYL